MSEIIRLIKKKRDGGELTEEDVQLFTTDIDKWQDCQISAMLMAMCMGGLNTRETVSLTKAYISSGQVFKWKPEWESVLVDKHSTGGIGDKVSIILAPALAACGLKVPMISGRSLEHTGGTLDKLSSIPGFQDVCSAEMMMRCMNIAGCFIGGPTQTFCPGDFATYRVRDVTGTVDNVQLITASILSKKMAEGIKHLIIDLKVGKAAFITTIEEARVLAACMKEVANNLGLNLRILMTRMDEPLGKTIGNSLEIHECVHCLRGQGSYQIKTLVHQLGGHLLWMSGKVKSLEEGESMIREVLRNQQALKTFHKMLTCQGVAENVAEELCYGETWRYLPNTTAVKVVKTNKSGYITYIDGLILGKSCYRLGIVRKAPGDAIDHASGFRLLYTIGDKVEIHEPWLEIYCSADSLDQSFLDSLNEAIVISETFPGFPDLIMETIL